MAAFEDASSEQWDSIYGGYLEQLVILDFVLDKLSILLEQIARYHTKYFMSCVDFTHEDVFELIEHMNIDDNIFSKIYSIMARAKHLEAMLIDKCRHLLTIQNRVARPHA